MDNFLSGGIEELEAAKRAIIDEAEKNLAADEAKSAFKAKDKELNARKMFLNDKIDSTVKNRRNELEKEHDAKLEEAKKDVREAKKNKKDALSKAVSERIKDETADLVAANKSLKKENKELFKSAKIPGFCTGRYYYAMFVPRSGGDFVLFVLSIIIAVALIPNVVCAILSIKTILKIIIYIAIVIFFVLIYFLITIWTKSGQKASVLESGRPNMNKIKQNKKAIKKLKKGIKKDSDEAQYGLESFNSEIENSERAFEERSKEKQSALAEFDEKISVQIKNETEAEIMPQIEKLSEEAASLEEIYNQKASIAAAASENLNSEYLIYLGERYATCERIDELISIIKEGKASNISEALDTAKGTGK